MAVPKGKRQEGELAVITKATEFAEFTIKICSNERNFPKRYRWCLTSKITDGAFNILSYENKANAIRVVTRDDYDLRRRYQQMALAETAAMESMLDIAYRLFGVENGRVRHWTGLLIEVQKTLRSWILSDYKRYGEPNALENKEKE